MRQLRHGFALVTLLSVLSLATFAGNRSGSVTGQFLKLPINARSVGMGNAQVALAEGALSIAYNPAGILSIPDVSFGATYNQWWADITHSFIGGAINLNEIGTIGVGMLMLSTDDMLVRTPAFPEGTGEKFKAYDVAYTVSYARRISEDFGIGINAKIIRSNLYNKELSANSFAVDIGTLYDVPVLRTRLGISLNNLGEDLSYISETYSLPTVLRFGARVTVFDEEDSKMFVALQVGRPNDSDEQYNVGFEYIVFNALSLRGGYRFNYDAENWSAGLGMSLKSLGLNGRFDYAFTNYQILPGTHMFSLELGI
jgi:hypothetical protein